MVGVWVGQSDSAGCMPCNGPSTAAPLLFRALGLLPQRPLARLPAQHRFAGTPPPALTRLATCNAPLPREQGLRSPYLQPAPFSLCHLATPSHCAPPGGAPCIAGSWMTSRASRLPAAVKPSGSRRKRGSRRSESSMLAARAIPLSCALSAPNCRPSAQHRRPECISRHEALGAVIRAQGQEKECVARQARQLALELIRSSLGEPAIGGLAMLHTPRKQQR